MNLAILNAMSVPELVAMFTDIALAQDNALLGNEISRYNHLYDDLVAVRDELKSRPGDQRIALLPLLTHRNAQVRLKAALHSLAVARVAARQALQDISDRNEYPQAADARMTLDALDIGTSKLI